jgi:hypothetical protein
MKVSWKMGYGKEKMYKSVSRKCKKLNYRKNKKAGKFYHL